MPRRRATAKSKRGEYEDPDAPLTGRPPNPRSVRKRRFVQRWKAAEQLPRVGEFECITPVAENIFRSGKLLPIELTRKWSQHHEYLGSARQEKKIVRTPRPVTDKETMRKEKEYKARQRAFLRNLRAARKAAIPPLNQKEVADRLGRHQTYISKAERGELRLDFVQVEQLAEIYGVSLDFFRTGGTTK